MLPKIVAKRLCDFVIHFFCSGFETGFSAVTQVGLELWHSSFLSYPGFRITVVTLPVCAYFY